MCVKLLLLLAVRAAVRALWAARRVWVAAVVARQRLPHLRSEDSSEVGLAVR